MNMKGKIIILNYMKYVKKDKDKGTEQPMTRIQYAFADPQDTEKFCGFTTIDGYYKGHDVFNKLSKGILLKELDAEFELSSDYYNPNNLRRMLVKINGISLL